MTAARLIHTAFGYTFLISKQPGGNAGNTRRGKGDDMG